MPNPIPPSKRERAFVVGRFELDLDGVRCGVLHSVDGGNFKSESIGEKVGGDALVTRYPGRQKFEDITFQLGPKAAPAVWKWVKASLANKPERKHGAIIALDIDSNERSRRDFFDAVFSEMQFPAVDAKSKEGKRFTIKIAPERVEYSNKPERGDRPVEADIRIQKQALPSSFSLRIDGIDRKVMSNVAKVEAFSVKQNVIDNPMGGLLFTRKEFGRVDYPNLTFSIPETFVKPFMKWWEEFVGRGNHTHANERNGALVYLDSTRAKELGSVSFQGLGITSITLDKHEGHADGVRMAKVELYMESLDFEFKV